MIGSIPPAKIELCIYYLLNGTGASFLIREKLQPTADLHLMYLKRSVRIIRLMVPWKIWSEDQKGNRGPLRG